jgi:hypothetical protein
VFNNAREVPHGIHIYALIEIVHSSMARSKIVGCLNKFPVVIKFWITVDFNFRES